MTTYDEQLCRAMDEQHYAHYEMHRGLWDGSLYDFLRGEYRRLFEDVARGQPRRPIVVHYVGPGLNHPCLRPEVWEPIIRQIQAVHLYDIDDRVLDTVRRVVPEVIRPDGHLCIQTHRTDITGGMGRALLEWAESVKTGVGRLRVPPPEYFDSAELDGDWAAPVADRQVFSLVISEMAVSSTGLGVFWELYGNPAFRSLGVTPEFVNSLERVYNTCVARRHTQWISRHTAGRGLAVVSADVERIYLGTDVARRVPTFGVSLPLLFREFDLRVESAAESVWKDIPTESAAGIPPHVHRVVCCAAADMRQTIPPRVATSHALAVGPVGQGC